jgi:hypothetical protein
MTNVWIYGPIFMSAVMIGALAVMTERVYRAHKRAVKAAMEYTATLEWAAAYLKEHPEAYAEATKMVMEAAEKRRMH